MNISGVILAAGCSTRAGDFKITRIIHEKPVIEYVVDAMSSVCNEITVVTGYMKEKLSYLPSRYDSLKLVFNKQYSDGMFSSLMAGLEAFQADYAIICPGDCPGVSRDVYKRLIEEDYGINVPQYNGFPGHPTCIRKDMISILQSGRYSTLREFISSCGCHAVNVDDPAILMDVDYPEDFKSMEDYMRRRKFD